MLPGQHFRFIVFDMVNIVLVVGGLLVLSVLGAGVTRALSRIRTLEKQPSTRVPHPFVDDELWDAIHHLRASIKDQTLAIDEGILRVDRAENRVKETVRRAQARATAAGYDAPGVEAEALELQRWDGEGSEGVPVLHEVVEEVEQEASSVRGVTVEQLQRARGF